MSLKRKFQISAVVFEFFWKLPCLFFDSKGSSCGWFLSGCARNISSLHSLRLRVDVSLTVQKPWPTAQSSRDSILSLQVHLQADVKGKHALRPVTSGWQKELIFNIQTSNFLLSNLSFTLHRKKKLIFVLEEYQRQKEKEGRSSRDVIMTEKLHLSKHCSSSLG